MAVRILLADDHAIVREGMRALISRVPELDVVAQAETGRETLEKCRECVPDVVVMDIAMPDLNGVEATRQIVDEFPCTRVLALSVHSGRNMVSAMLQAGASGYLIKKCAADELITAVRAVVDGKTYLSPDISDMVVQDYLNTMPDDLSSAFSVLTDREREVLQLVAEGLTTKAIAHDLDVSVKTIETHRQHVMEKLDIHSVAELTKYAVREGLTSIEK